MFKVIYIRQRIFQYKLRRILSFILNIKGSVSVYLYSNEIIQNVQLIQFLGWLELPRDKNLHLMASWENLIDWANESHCNGLTI